MNRNNYARRVYLWCGLLLAALFAFAWYNTPGGIEAKCYELTANIVWAASCWLASRIYIFALTGD